MRKASDRLLGNDKAASHPRKEKNKPRENSNVLSKKVKRETGFRDVIDINKIKFYNFAP